MQESWDSAATEIPLSITLLGLQDGNYSLIEIFCNFIFMIMLQGIWLCEHRDYPTARKVVVTLNGI